MAAADPPPPQPPAPAQPSPAWSPSAACAQCGAPTPPGARFCPGCGRPLPGASAIAPARRRGSSAPWFKVAVAVIAAAAVVVTTVVVLLAVGFRKAANSVANSLTPKAGRPPGYQGPAYPGMLVQDKVAVGPGASIEFGGQDLTAGALTPRTGLFGLGNTLCTTVTTVDRATTSVNVGPADWKLQAPDGTVATFQLNSSLETGQIAPGARASGTVCFADTGPSGTYELLWQPLFQVGRGVWLLHP
ncbi:MAG: zinc ribbon domain-containing protein [Acidimicrobiales bacterium]